jgi:hypothetical protein
MSCYRVLSLDGGGSWALIQIKALIPNQPIRMDGDSLTCELGQERFGAARLAWEELKAGRTAKAATESL